MHGRGGRHSGGLRVVDDGGKMVAKNARPQCAFVTDEHREMRAGRAHFPLGIRGCRGEKTRFIFRVENARAQRAFSLASCHILIVL